MRIPVVCAQADQTCTGKRAGNGDPTDHDGSGNPISKSNRVPNQDSNPTWPTGCLRPTHGPASMSAAPY